MKMLYISLMAAVLLAGCGPVGAGGSSGRIVAVAQTSAPTAAPSAAATEAAGATPAASDLPTASATPTESQPFEAPTPHPAPQEDGTLIRVYKGERRLELWKDGALEHACAVGLGFSPTGHKEREGDGRTPQGTYYVCTRNDQSRYYLSLGLSYPNEADAAAALAEGRISPEECEEIAEAIRAGRRPPWNTPLGGEIMIHGRGGGSDWTAGCVAVDDGDMDILWEHGALGTVVQIYP